MIFYEKKLWKYDPFVKIPRLHKEYEGVFISSYDSKERKVTMTIVRRHIVGGANRTLFSVDLPPRLCRTGT